MDDERRGQPDEEKRHENIDQPPRQTLGDHGREAPPGEGCSRRALLDEQVFKPGF